MQPKTPEKPRPSSEIPEILEQLLHGELPGNWRERLSRERTRIFEGALEARDSLIERIEKALEEDGIGKDVRQALEGLVAEIRSLATSEETKGVLRGVRERWTTWMSTLARWSRLGTEAIEKNLERQSPFGKFFSYLGLAGLSFLRGFSLFFGGKEEELQHGEPMSSRAPPASADESDGSRDEPPKMPDDFEGPLPGPREEPPSVEAPEEEAMPEPERGVTSPPPKVEKREVTSPPPKAEAEPAMPKPEKPASGHSAAWDSLLGDGRITAQEGKQFLKNPALKRELLSAPQAEQDRILTLMIRGDASGEFRKKLEKASGNWDSTWTHDFVVKALAKEGLSEAEGEKLIHAYRRLKKSGAI